MNDALDDIYRRLLRRFGPQGWWPAETPDEVVVGTILTQNTNWNNVEKAIANLRRADALSLAKIDSLARSELERLIRPSGFFRQKAFFLQQFTGWLHSAFEGRLERLLALPFEQLRQELLSRPGIGPETADSILLYAAGKPSFVVDAYTHRVLVRVGLEPEGTKYEMTRALFMHNLPHDPLLFNEFHALFVRLAKEHCRRRKPCCHDCPLLALCNYGKAATGD